MVQKKHEMRKFVFLMLLYSSLFQAQEHAWVYFKDKPSAESYLNAPISMLTQRALDRRSLQNIEVNIQDVPVEHSYVTAVRSSQGIVLKARSRWLNAVHVMGNQAAIEQLIDLASVDRIQFANKNSASPRSPILSSSKIIKSSKFASLQNLEYGEAENQVKMIGIDSFHTAGYEGLGKQIAIIDAGFYGVDTAGAFSHLFDGEVSNGEILGGYDFVTSSGQYYQDTGTSHGTHVLSTIAAIKEDEFVGTAPKSSFYLFITEEVSNESPLEESLWVQAAERADSLGVDILNTSLGYSEFDDARYNYTYADMDGKTTFITRGANIAAQKGIVVVNSIGNSGNDAWQYLTAPSDAKNIVAVGAVNIDRSMTSFSSYGPSSDQRVKPETLAQGGDVKIVDSDNIVKTSNGTSFSGPIIAGAVACLWEFYPEKSSLEIRDLIIQNSNLFMNPTQQGGYGLLNLTHLITELPVSREIKLSPFSISFLNDIKTLRFQFNEPIVEALDVQVFSVAGVILKRKFVTEFDCDIKFTDVAQGLYYLRYSYKNKNELMTFYKMN